jgi:hypothetical protein
LFLSKFIALFSVISVVYCSVFSFQVYLLGLSPIEPMVYVSFLGLILQLLLFSSLSVALSIIIKNEVVSILASILLLYGVENIASSSITYWTSAGRYKILFGYFGLLTHGELPSGFMFIPTINDVAVAIIFPLLLSFFIITICFFYYTRVMEID